MDVRLDRLENKIDLILAMVKDLAAQNGNSKERVGKQVVCKRPYVESDEEDEPANESTSKVVNSEGSDSASK